MARLLIVDDDPHIRDSLRERLLSRGHQISVAVDAREAAAKIRLERPELVLLDLQIPEGGGFAVLDQIRREGIETTVVIITAFGTVERAVQAMKAGAYDLIQKPFEPSLIEETIRRALERAGLRRENRALSLEGEEFEPVFVDSRSRELAELASRAAKSSATVLITGETGTGKEVLAREIHRAGGRSGRPFVAVSCVALHENLLESELFGHEKGAFTGAVSRRIGKIELAHGGTLFLDEIGDISPAFQAKLLRVLQERTFERVGGNETIGVEVRVLAATHRDLKSRVAEGKFREDLYYRLNVVGIHVPPLRERPGDIRPLVERFLAAVCRRAARPVPQLEEDAGRILQNHPWPGNVRELHNVIERTIVFLEGDMIGAGDLPADLLMAPNASPPGSFHAQVAEFRSRLIQEALQRNEGNQTRAAEDLGLQRTYLARLIRQLGL
jgi:DNA-binding NtrC family response regulator